MTHKRPMRAYHYRGLIERGARRAWREGYSAYSKDGGVLYPWCTRRECRKEAKAEGFEAIFFRNGEREDPSRIERFLKREALFCVGA